MPASPLSSTPPCPPALSDDRERAVLRLSAWFQDCPGAAVAFSGGVDSALVAFLARRFLGSAKTSAWISTSPSLSREDLAVARDFCRAHDIPLHELATRELEISAYARNHLDRCFYCKTTLYADIAAALPALHPGAWICNGTNADDPGDYRPGLQAAARAHVRQPLLDCAIDKTTVREVARHFGLAVWDKPASPCLSSRIPYGQPVTTTKLARIEAAETWLHRAGFPECRVRHWSDAARVEVPPSRVTQLEAVRGQLEAALLALGFAAVEIDGEGLVSGKLNRGLAPASAPAP